MSVLFFCIHGKWTWVRQWQIFREPLRGSRDLSRASPKFISHERRKKDTHSLIIYTWLQPVQSVYLYNFSLVHQNFLRDKVGQTCLNENTWEHTSNKFPDRAYITELSIDIVWVYWCLKSHATIFQSYMRRHRCADGLEKKLYLRFGLPTP